MCLCGLVGLLVVGFMMWLLIVWLARDCVTVLVVVGLYCCGFCCIVLGCCRLFAVGVLVNSVVGFAWRVILLFCDFDDVLLGFGYCVGCLCLVV